MGSMSRQNIDTRKGLLSEKNMKVKCPEQLECTFSTQKGENQILCDFVCLLDSRVTCLEYCF
jgi:hypothetical protein